ncbi:hypothetical protein, partial [Yersinia pseudotuberculosis]|uniref:hypothetical protein n=1 Tax=Yersinia pseudotuberculosis TaxID=633 RepID=UPI001E41F86B
FAAISPSIDFRAYFHFSAIRTVLGITQIDKCGLAQQREDQIAIGRKVGRHKRRPEVNLRLKAVSG